MSKKAQRTAGPRRRSIPGSGGRLSFGLRQAPARLRVIAAFPILVLLGGCTSAPLNSANGTFSVSPGTPTIDTNCTGCKATNLSGTPVEQFSAVLNSGGAAGVTWSVSGGDANSGAGTINAATGQDTPPAYLTADSVQIIVTAALCMAHSATPQANELDLFRRHKLLGRKIF